MDDIFSPKNLQNFYCEFCDYKSSKQSDYNKHLLTLKHKKRTNGLPMDDDLSQTIIFQCSCGNQYKHRQGLWKHKKNCCKKKSRKSRATRNRTK